MIDAFIARLLITTENQNCEIDSQPDRIAQNPIVTMLSS